MRFWWRMIFNFMQPQALVLTFSCHDIFVLYAFLAKFHVKGAISVFYAPPKSDCPVISRNNEAGGIVLVASVTKFRVLRVWILVGFWIFRCSYFWTYILKTYKPIFGCQTCQNGRVCHLGCFQKCSRVYTWNRKKKMYGRSNACFPFFVKNIQNINALITRFHCEKSKFQFSFAMHRPNFWLLRKRSR